MEYIKLVLASKEEAFLNKVIKCVLDKELGFDVAMFTDVDSLSKYLEDENNIVDLIVIDDYFVSPRIIKNINAKTKIFISNEDSFEIKNFKKIDKNLKADEFLNIITEIYFDDEMEELMEDISAIKTKTVGFYSPSGGSGSTLLSLLFALETSFNKNQVFYINLEKYNCSSIFLKTKKELLPNEINNVINNQEFFDFASFSSLVDKDKKTGISFFPFLKMDEKNYVDYFEILINMIKVCNMYKYIIVDFSSNYYALQKQINSLDNLFVIVSDNVISDKKTELFLKELNYDNKYIILNKYKYENAEKNKNLVNCVVKLPFINGLEKELDLIKIRNYFKKELLSIYKLIEE